MEKYPFTPGGVQAKQRELYALPDNELQEQAAMIETSFTGYVLNNFSLDRDQEAYLNSMAQESVVFNGMQFGIAIKNRLPIVMDPPIPAPAGKKSVSTDVNIKDTYNSTTGVNSLEGGITLHFHP